MLLVPLATMSVVAVALSTVFRIRTSAMLSHLFVAQLPFSLFSGTVTAASQSLLAHQDIIRRHSVDRIVFPISAAIVCIVEYLVASLALVALGPFLPMHL